jgi:hypothetical protein
MPTPVINQPTSVAPALALAAMFCGREKIPPPTMEPTTSAINAPRRSFCVESDISITSVSQGDIGIERV